MQSLSLLVHGHSKVGKSTLAGTSPPPLLILDAEGSTKFLPLRMRPWNPKNDPPPAYDGTWDAVVVNVMDFESLDKTFQWLRTGNHHFRSLALDSVTEAQRKLKTALVGSDKMQRENWDELLRNMDALVRGLRDLTQHPTNPLMAAVFICETRMEDGKLKPNMQGQIKTSLPYWFDIVGYLTVDAYRNADGSPVMDQHGRSVKLRRLHIAPDNPMWEAGERVQGRLPDIIEEPNISTMLVTVFPGLAG